MTDEQPTDDSQTPNIAANVKAAREARGWSQRDLAKELTKRGAPINQAALSRLEMGEREPRFAEVKELAQVFGVSMEALDIAPEEFSRTVEWTAIRGAFSDARRDLRQAADRYERAADRLVTYMAASHPAIPDDLREVLQRQGAQSGVGVALEQCTETIKEIDGDSAMERRIGGPLKAAGANVETVRVARSQQLAHGDPFTRYY